MSKGDGGGLRVTRWRFPAVVVFVVVRVLPHPGAPPWAPVVPGMGRGRESEGTHSTTDGRIDAVPNYPVTAEGSQVTRPDWV